MQVKTYKTKKVVVGDTLYPILDESLPKLEENSVVIITSKIVAICQGRVIKAEADGLAQKRILVPNEAEYYLREEDMRYGFQLSINRGIFIASAGIDQSNGDGYLIFWPEKIQETVNAIWDYLREKNKIDNLGIIISDSKLQPLRWGTTGVGIAYCGFAPLNDFRGKPDIFGHELRVTQANVLDGLTASAVLVMGESNEQTPLAVITDVPFVQFRTHPPTPQELASQRIDPEGDVYAPIIQFEKFKKGHGPR